MVWILLALLTLPRPKRWPGSFPSRASGILSSEWGLVSTGCTLSAAICAALAAGASLRAAVSEAKRFVWQALQHGQMIDIGRGNGPLNHLHAWK
ncbi:MAG TPA: hypothetical protein ENJ72_00545 [Thermodesulfatator sp.]|nr:hypothetical protein [Thermodesulfatator sp.]